MTDTHTHIYFPEFEDKDALMARAREAGVNHFVLPNVDEDSIPFMNEFHERYPEVTTMAIGLHPTEVKEDWQRAFKTMERELATGKYKGIGEVGMDLYWDKTFQREQEEAFDWQLRLAEEAGLPVIIHSRDAFWETVKAIEKVNPGVNLIFHSFTGGPEDVEMIKKVCDPYFGINGVVTYKNAPTLREAISAIGIEKILLETDSPYLTPVPHRGKRNESAYVVHVMEKVAETLEMMPADVERVTDESAQRVFNL